MPQAKGRFTPSRKPNNMEAAGDFLLFWTRENGIARRKTPSEAEERIENLESFNSQTRTHGKLGIICSHETPGKKQKQPFVCHHGSVNRPNIPWMGFGICETTASAQFLCLTSSHFLIEIVYALNFVEPDRSVPSARIDRPLK